MGILVLGCGGHAKVVADILLQQGRYVKGFLDDNPALWHTHWLDLPVLGPLDSYAEHEPEGMVVGIGANGIRRRIVERFGAAARELWINAIHPAAVVAASTSMGTGVVVAAGAIINPDAMIGNHVIVNTAATVDHDCMIQDYVHIAPGVNLAGDVQIDEETFVGIGSSVIQGRSIGKRVTIGAGAVVVTNVPDHVTAKGVPARW